MREIKFRAWDKQRKEFLSAGQVLISVQPGRRPDRNPQYLDILTDPDKYRDRFSIQQFTGLKDRSGNDIYEGDIFEAQSWIAVVEWDETNGRFLGFTVSGERKIVYIGREPQPVKIIGNICENPDLIK
jgi:uncharacterized phage protein (TIGR01671 family)